MRENVPTAALPVREISDPLALRALAHPARMRLLEELAIGDPATATDLAERVGESVANCSWHLRQLARYGWVEEAGGGTGRKRPWRLAARHNSWPVVAADPQLALAAEAATALLFTRELERFREWYAAARREPPQWREAPFSTQAVGWLTAAELAELGEKITALLLRYTSRVADPSTRPAGARPIRLVAWGIPARPAEEPSAPPMTPSQPEVD